MKTIHQHPERKIFCFVAILAIFLIATAWFLSWQNRPGGNGIFDGDIAYQDVVYQVSLGPRVVGSQSHEQVVNWMVDTLGKNHWKVEVQKTELEGVQIQNVIAKRGSGSPWIILGAHYDSRQHADNDPDPALQNTPVPGANDGASGVAVLMELARTLPKNVKGEVWLVFFDAEDNGNSTGSGWILGSQAFVTNLRRSSNKLPDDAVVIDMIGDADLNIYKEYNSNPELNDSIWKQAAQLGFNQFIPEYKYRMLDDHIPFLDANIPAVDIIDFDYPYWHTTQDTADKVSVESLQVVGKTLLAWLISH